MTDYPRPTVSELEASLAAMRERHEASNARRDEHQTDVADCALSCWAEGANEKKLLAQLSLARDGYMAEFPALFDINTNEEVPAKLIKGRYGLCWAITDSEGSFTGGFINYNHPDSMTARQARNLAKKGYKVALVKRPAHIESSSGAYLGAPISYFPAPDSR